MGNKHLCREQFEHKINKVKYPINYHTQPHSEREKAILSLSEVLRSSIRTKNDRSLVNSLVAKLEHKLSDFDSAFKSQCLDHYRTKLSRMPRNALENEFVKVQSNYLSNGLDISDIKIHTLNLLIEMRGSLR